MATITAPVVWTCVSILALLERSAAALEKAILAINARQTPDEQIAQHTTHQNGRGWNSCDASFGGSLARWIERGLLPRNEGGFGKLLGSCLTPKQRAGGLRMVRKYWLQLLEEIALKGGTVSFKNDSSSLEGEELSTPSVVSVMPEETTAIYCQATTISGIETDIDF